MKAKTENNKKWGGILALSIISLVFTLLYTFCIGTLAADALGIPVYGIVLVFLFMYVPPIVVSILVALIFLLFVVAIFISKKNDSLPVKKLLRVSGIMVLVVTVLNFVGCIIGLCVGRQIEIVPYILSLVFSLAIYLPLWLKVFKRVVKKPAAAAAPAAVESAEPAVAAAEATDAPAEDAPVADDKAE